MDLLTNLLETYTALTRRVENLEQDKIAQALEITKLKQRVRRLEKKRKLRVSGLKRLKKVGTAQKDAKVTKDADVQGRLEESQAQVYHIDLEHADKVLSMQDNKPKPAELKEVIEVVTTAKIMTKVVNVAATTITAAPIAATTIIAAPSAARRRKGVVIRDPEETATPSTIVHSEPKSKDKRKGILVEEPKPLKKQAQIEQDEAYARELEAELNKNINWDDVIEQIKRKEKRDNAVLRYQALKRKPQTEAHAKKNIMVYLKNMAGFKMNFFKGMSYDDIIPILEKYFNFNVAFLEKSEKELEEEASRALKRKTKSSEQQASKKQKLDEEVPVIDYKIYTEYNKPYYKIIRADGTHQLFLSFLSLLRNFNREDLEMILLVERRYTLTRFTLDQMLNDVRLEVKEESEVSLELLRFVRRQQQEGYRPDFRVDVVEDFKENMLRDYYCWLKTYCYWYKLKLLDNTADSRLRLLEQSAAIDDKMKKYH
nr:hypothetical protein [Tanacetum cinerariifolium]